jgi:hypothetical protein
MLDRRGAALNERSCECLGCSCDRWLSVLLIDWTDEVGRTGQAVVVPRQSRVLDIDLREITGLGGRCLESGVRVLRATRQREAGGGEPSVAERPAPDRHIAGLDRIVTADVIVNYGDSVLVIGSARGQRLRLRIADAQPDVIREGRRSPSAGGQVTSI